MPLSRGSKPRVELVVGLDIGSTNIRIAVGQVTMEKDYDPQLHILGVASVSSDGVQKGGITSIEDTVSAISSGLEKMEQLIGIPIEHVWVGVSTPDILPQESRGVVAVSRTSGEISEEDVDRVIEAAKTVAGPLNYEVLHVLPRSFTVDGQTNIKDPVGMTGVRLEVDTKIVHGPTTHIKNVEKAVYRTGLDINDFVLTTLAASEAVTTADQKELGVVVVNIGGPTTSIAVYEEGDLLHTAVLPLGSSHITNDLALGLKTSIDIAERVKREYGSCIGKGITKKDTINLADLGADESEEVAHQYVIEIIQARVAEILEKVNDELSQIDRSGLLPAGATFVGGGSKIRGLIEFAREELQLPATLGRVHGVGGIQDEADDLAYVPVVGLVRWGSLASHQSGNSRTKLTRSKMAGAMQKLFKSFVP